MKRSPARGRGRGRGKKKSTCDVNIGAAVVPLGATAAADPAIEPTTTTASCRRKNPSSSPPMALHTQPSPPAAVAATATATATKRNNGKRRRQHEQLRHEIATWWRMPSPDNRGEAAAQLPQQPASVKAASPPGGKPNAVEHDNNGDLSKEIFRRDGAEVTNMTALSEGENWVVCSFMEECKKKQKNSSDAMTTSEQQPLRLSISKSHRNLYLDARGRIEGEGAGAAAAKIRLSNGKGDDESILAAAEDDNDAGKSIFEDIPILCIDVDNMGHCVAVKDIRLGYSSDTNNHHPPPPLDAEIQRALDGLEFFLVRRRPREVQQQPKNNPLLGKKNPLRHATCSSNNHEAKSEDVLLNRDKKETTIGSDSENEGTSGGYGTDDEQDANDEMEELNERNEVRFCDDLGGGPFQQIGDHANNKASGYAAGMHCRRRHNHAAPPREADVDHEGNMLYHPPEILPRRQLRVLRSGDRVLMRYWSPNQNSETSECQEPPCQEPPCVKLEYLHGQQSRHPQRRRLPTPKAVMIPTTPQLADNNNANKTKTNGGRLEETLGKPRLLSVKSAEGKSYEKKRFTLNSTSAADAPSDDAKREEHAKKVAAAATAEAAAADAAAANNANTDGEGRRKAGEDWSDVESPKKDGPEEDAVMLLNAAKKGVGEGGEGGGGGGGGAHANDNNKTAEDDDDGMEEYSYLTGEVMVKDQDYISAITGDDATMPPVATAQGEEDEDEDEDAKQDDNDGGDGDDAATASAVVLGAATSPAKATSGMSRGVGQGDEKMDVDSGEEQAPSEIQDEDKEDGQGDCKPQPGNCEQTNQTLNEVKFIEEVDASKANDEDQDVFLTALEQDIDEDNDNDIDEDNGSEEELLSQPDDNEESAVVKFEIAEEAEKSINDQSSDDDDDSTTDVSKTQPFVIPKSAMQNTSFHSLSTAGEEEDDEEKDDDDDSTVCPVEDKDDQNDVAATKADAREESKEADGVRSSSPPAKLEAVADTAARRKENEKQHDPDDDGSIEQSTQPLPCSFIQTHDDKDQNAALENDGKEQPCSPTKHGAASNPSDKEGLDKKNQLRHHLPDDDDDDEEPTQKFPMIKPLGDVNNHNQHDDEDDDDVYQVETQNEYDVYQEETQALLPLDLSATLPHPQEPLGPATNAMELNEDRPPSMSEQPKSPIDSAVADEINLKQKDLLKEARGNEESSITSKNEDEGQDKSPAKSDIQNKGIEIIIGKGKDLTIRNEATSEPTAAKGVPSTPEQMSPNSPPAKEPLCDTKCKSLSTLPEQTGNVVENERHKMGQVQDPKTVTLPPANEPQSAAKEKYLPLSHEGLKKTEEHDDPAKLPPTKEPASQNVCKSQATSEGNGLALSPEKKNDAKGLKLGEQRGLETSEMHQAKERAAQVPEGLAVAQDELPPCETSGIMDDRKHKNEQEHEIDPRKPLAAKDPPAPVPRRRSVRRTTYDDSAIQKQRLENSAVTRVPSGAIMTGPVGGAIALPSPRYPRHKKAKPNLLTSIAASTTKVLNLKPLPDAAASSEETTVCHMENIELKKDQGSTTFDEAPNEKVARSSLQKREGFDERNGYADSRDRDPDIPSTISCINTRGGHLRHPNKIRHHRPKRKRGISSGRRRESNEPVRIMFTGINPTRRHKQMISDIGAQLVDSVEDALTATHVIASDGKTKLRRTPKLMICVCKTSRILSIEWLEQSAKEQRVLETDDFLLLGDREAEKRYNFSMKETLENGAIARLDRGGVLGGWSVYICSGVAGNNAPSSKDLTLIVQATGATLLNDLKMVVDPPQTIVITSEPSTQSQMKERGVARVEGLGAKILPVSWLFHTIITQNVSTTDVSTPPSGKQRPKRKASKSPTAHASRRKSSRKR